VLYAWDPAFWYILYYHIHMFSFRKRFATLGDTMKMYPITTVILGVICTIALLFIWDRFLSLWVNQLDLLGKLLAIWLVYVVASAAVTKRFFDEPLRHMIWHGVLFVCMLAYFFVLPTSFEDAPQSIFIRHVLIQITAVVSLLVVTLWTTKRNEQSMYHGVIQLVLHAVLAWLFSLVLAWWIMWAMWWIEQLFGIDIVSEWYSTIFAVVWILFGGLSFLDGVKKWIIDEDEDSQPLKWKTLLGWVVGFLLLVYGIILYIYLGKILMTGEWPSNQVTPLSFAFSGLVVLGSILLVPLVTDEQQLILRKKILIRMYISLIPILVMVFFAIKLRIGQYGVTEMRYILCALLLWLLISAGYMIMSKKKDLRWVALIFSVVTIVSFAGWPISASWWAKSCQFDNLEEFVSQHNVQDEHGLLSKEKISALSTEGQQELADLLRYLVDYHGGETIDTYYSWTSDSSYTVLDTLWLPTYRSWNMGEDKVEYIYLSVQESPDSVNLEGYSRMYRNISWYAYNRWMSNIASWVTTELNGTEFILTIDAQEHIIQINQLTEEFMERRSNTNEYDNSVPRDAFVYAWSGYTLLFSSLHWQKTIDGVFSLESVTFDILIE